MFTFLIHLNFYLIEKTIKYSLVKYMFGQAVLLQNWYRVNFVNLKLVINK